jgi:hypothetical protein
MNWAEHIENYNDFSDLSNSELLESISVMKEKVAYFHSRELVRLERMKSKAIISNLELFEKVRNQYETTRSTPPSIWFENWEIYLTILAEAEKRELFQKVG